MPVVPVSVAGAAVTTVAAAALGKKNVPLGWSITASGAGTIDIKSQSRVIHTIVSPNSEKISPADLIRWDNLVDTNEPLTMTASGAGVTYGGTFEYVTQDTTRGGSSGSPLGLLFLITKG